MCTQSECFWIDDHWRRKDLPPNCKKKPTCEMFTHPLDPYKDVDVSVFPFSKLRQWWLVSFIIGNTETDAELLSGN